MFNLPYSNGRDSQPTSPGHFDQNTIGSAQSGPAELDAISFTGRSIENIREDLKQSVHNVSRVDVLVRLAEKPIILGDGYSLDSAELTKVLICLNESNAREFSSIRSSETKLEKVLAFLPFLDPFSRTGQYLTKYVAVNELIEALKEDHLIEIDLLPQMSSALNDYWIGTPCTSSSAIIEITAFGRSILEDMPISPRQ